MGFQPNSEKPNCKEPQQIIKLNISQKQINFTKSVVKERLNTFCCLEKSPSCDVFQLATESAVKKAVTVKPAAKTIDDIKKILETPEMQKRGLFMSSYVEHVLRNKALVPPFEKLLTARKSTLALYEVLSIVKSLTPERIKYLDVLLEPESVDKSIKWKNLDGQNISKALENLFLIEKPKLIEIMSDKKLTFKGAVTEIIKEEISLGLKQINDPQIKVSAEKFYAKASNKKASGFFRPEVFSQYANIESKLQNVEDQKIRDHVYSDLDKYRTNHMKALDELLDAYHVSKGDYSNVGGDLNEYYKALGKSKPGEQNMLKRYVFEGNIEDFPFDNPAGIKPDALIDFKKESKLDGLKKYIISNKDSQSQSKIVDYMYKKYYLNSLPEASKQEHLKILKEFKTKLFCVENPEAPEIVYKELCQWKTAGGKDFKAPSVIDLSQIRDTFVGKAGGFFNKGENRVAVKGDSEWAINYALRHEIMHHQDKLFYQDEGVINGVDFDAIKENQLFKDELLDGGMGYHGLEDYAYTNKKEFVAVASTGDFSKYSNKLKETLVKLGMPEWVSKLELTNPEIKQNVEAVAEIRKYLSEQKKAQIVNI